ncbi:MAG: hypothetical protein Q7S22_05860 [Candidatus Micrarchaeota archaeon]|nr:hypothetical protein [Candidatus Micrarchaeota archaeon]
MKQKVKPNGRYLATATFTDGKAIRLISDFDGKGLRTERAKRTARQLVKDELKRHIGWNAIFYPLFGITEDEKVTYSQRKERDKENTIRHEAVHTKVHKEMPNVKFFRVIPLEESVAYAVADFYCRVNGIVQPTERIEKLQRKGFLTMRFMQHVHHDIGGRELESVVEELCKNAERPNKNIAFAFDDAANLLFYRECIAILEKHGLEKGEEILIQAINVTDMQGLHGGWEFILSHLERKKRGELIDGIAIKGKHIVILNPHSPRCDLKEYALADYY